MATLSFSPEFGDPSLLIGNHSNSFSGQFLQGVNESPKSRAVNFRSSDGKIKPEHLVVVWLKNGCIIIGSSLRWEVKVEAFEGDIKVGLEGIGLEVIKLYWGYEKFEYFCALQLSGNEKLIQ